MQKPTEGLDDFVAKGAPEQPLAPRPVMLRQTGEVEVVKPIAISRQGGGRTLPWLETFVVAGGTFALIGVVLLSAVAIEFYDSTVYRADGSNTAMDYPSDMPIDQRLYDEMVRSEDELPTDVPAEVPVVIDQLPNIRSESRGRRYKPRIRQAVYRSSPEPRRPRLVDTGFVPTTLVIYAENGYIKTRIEPQLKRPVS